MSRSGVDEAVERIQDDRSLVAAILTEGGSALSSFDLSDAERDALVVALRRDAEAAGMTADDEVASFSYSFAFTNVLGVGRDIGGGGPAAPPG
jgi:hypothetical protein